MNEWFRPAGSTGDAEWDVRIRPGDPGWSHTGLYAVTLAPGERRVVETGDCEWIVVPLRGSVQVELNGEWEQLRGRASVFDGPTDVMSVPRDSRFVVASAVGARVALPHARARTAYPAQVVRAEAIPVEVRGAGAATRQVHNFGMPGVLDADSILACEVITPAGNWSSYPPHKHDEERPEIEVALEEIYYIESRREGGEDDGDGFGYLRSYGTAQRPIDTLAQVRSGDVVLVPHGWHGPAMAPPGYELYYLNVMAGPGPVREWRSCDDPAHAWVRQTWARRAPDPRLPMSR